MSVYDNLSKLVNFTKKNFCEQDSSDCENCNHFDRGRCPVVLAEELLQEEGYEGDD